MSNQAAGPPPGSSDGLDELFAPPDVPWRRLSPRYLKLKRLSSLIAWPVVFSIPAVLFLVLSPFWWWALIFWLSAAAIVVLRWIFLPRSCASWGYAEREEDLYITHGIWFRSLTAVPYGRMQLVEVESGPIERKFGLATVTLKTASPDTDASIPGLEPDEAARLRDHLTTLGEARASGL